MLHLTHLDDVPKASWTYGHIDGAWSSIATDRGDGLPARAGSCRSVRIPPDAMPVPVHQHLGAEEVFVVLSGEGRAYELPEAGRARTYAVATGDVVVRRANEEAHGFVAGPGGLEVLAYGPNAAPRAEVFPRAGVLRLRGRWLEMDTGTHPWEREAELGMPRLLPPSSPRPARYVRPGAVPSVSAGSGVEVRMLGEAGGAEQVGVRRIAIAPDHADGPRRAHSSVERLVLVLGGSGHAHSGDEALPLRQGSALLASPGSGQAWRIVAGAEGLDLLDLCVLDPADMIHLPDSGEVIVPALGVALPARPLDA